MEWRYEIYRAIFVALGAMELITNFNFLLHKDGIKKARRQHKEIPQDVTDTQMKRKVILMFLFGVLFLSAGLKAYLMHQVNEVVFLVILSAFSVYAVAEAIYYRYRNTFGFASISLAMLVLFVI